MADLWQEIQEKLKDLAGSWASYLALGTFALYVLGYLAIRFHLTVLGIGTDLAVLDERYVFAGAKFLVYLFSSFPVVVLFALAIALVVFLLSRAYRFITKKKGSTFWNLPAKLQWLATPNGAALSGIVISVLMIQLVMRKSFTFSNVLLDGIPDSGIGLESLLLKHNETGQLFYFLGLLSATTVCAVLWLYARRQEQTTLSKALIMLLASLVILQVLFLPINYGIFIMDKSIPRVLDLGDQVSLPKNQKAWLVWEGTHGLTYLVHETGCSVKEQSAASPPDSGTAAGMPSQASTSPSSSETKSPLPSPVASAAANQSSNATSSTTPAPQQTNPQPTSGSNQNPAGATPVAQTSPTIPPCTLGAVVSPDGIIRKLVTLPQQDQKRTQILGYDPVSTLSFLRLDTEP